MFIRFLIVGGIGFLIDAGMTHLLIKLMVSPWLARIPAIGFAILFTWLANRHFTYKVNRPRSTKEAIRYVAVALSLATLNYLIYIAFLSAKVIPFFSIVYATAIQTILSFHAYKRLVFISLPAKKTISHENNMKTVTSAFFASSYLIYILILYPGFMSTDSVVQILESRNGSFSDWHPPFLSLLWGYIDRIIQGPSGILLTQITLLWLSVYLIYLAFFANRRPVINAAILSLIMFFPLNIAIAGAIWKDVWLWAMLMLTIGALGYAKNNTLENKKKLLFVLLAFLSLIIALLFRHNAIFAAIPIIYFGLTTFIPTNNLKNILTCFLVGLFIASSSFLLTGIINNKISDKKTYPWIANAVFDISGIIVRIENNQEKNAKFQLLSDSLDTQGDLMLLESNYSNDYWIKLFRSNPPVFNLPIHNFNVFEGFSYIPKNSRNKLLTLWINSIIEHPLLWIKHRAKLSACLIGVSIFNNPWSPAMMDTNGFPEYLANIYGYNPDSNWIQKGLSWRINYIYEKVFLFKPYFYFSIVTIILIISISIKRYRDMACICIAASGILYEFSLFLFAPSPDFRYSQYMIFCSLFCILLLLNRIFDNKIQLSLSKS